jgi:hypothetical protein
LSLSFRHENGDTPKRPHHAYHDRGNPRSDSV